MNKTTDTVYKHLQQKAYFNALANTIVLSTIRQTSEALNLELDAVVESYQVLLELGVIEEYSEYQFIPALQFQIPNRLKKIMGLA